MLNRIAAFAAGLMLAGAAEAGTVNSQDASRSRATTRSPISLCTKR